METQRPRSRSKWNPSCALRGDPICETSRSVSSSVSRDTDSHVKTPVRRETSQPRTRSAVSPQQQQGEKRTESATAFIQRKLRALCADTSSNKEMLESLTESVATLTAQVAELTARLEKVQQSLDSTSTNSLCPINGPTDECLSEECVMSDDDDSYSSE